MAPTLSVIDLARIKFCELGDIGQDSPNLNTRHIIHNFQLANSNHFAKRETIFFLTETSTFTVSSIYCNKTNFFVHSLI